MVVLFIFSWRATAVLKFLNQIASAKDYDRYSNSTIIIIQHHAEALVSSGNRIIRSQQISA
jgi:hypothetical protein